MHSWRSARRGSAGGRRSSAGGFQRISPGTATFSDVPCLGRLLSVVRYGAGTWVDVVRVVQRGVSKKRARPHWTVSRNKVAVMLGN